MGDIPKEDQMALTAEWQKQALRGLIDDSNQYTNTVNSVINGYSSIVNDSLELLNSPSLNKDTALNIGKLMEEKYSSASHMIRMSGLLAGMGKDPTGLYAKGMENRSQAINNGMLFHNSMNVLADPNADQATKQNAAMVIRGFSMTPEGQAASIGVAQSMIKSAGDIASLKMKHLENPYAQLYAKSKLGLGGHPTDSDPEGKKDKFVSDLMLGFFNATSFKSTKDMSPEDIETTKRSISAMGEGLTKMTGLDVFNQIGSNQSSNGTVFNPKPQQ